MDPYRTKSLFSSDAKDLPDEQKPLCSLCSHITIPLCVSLHKNELKRCRNGSDTNFFVRCLQAKELTDGSQSRPLKVSGLVALFASVLFFFSACSVMVFFLATLDFTIPYFCSSELGE